MLEDNGIPAAPIVDALIPIVASQIAIAKGVPIEVATKHASDAVRYYGKGEPFCCRLGDKKLQSIVTKVATSYEIKKAARKSQ